MRFCKFIKFSGFQEFREKLQKEFALSRWQPPSQEILRHQYRPYKPYNIKSENTNLQNINKISQKPLIFEQTKQALNALNIQLLDESIQKAVLILSKAKNILLLADQKSQPLASLFHQHSFMITDQVTFYPDKIMQHISINLLQRDDSILLFAQNKIPKSLIKNLLKAIKQGSKIIVISPSHSFTKDMFLSINNNNSFIHLPIIWPEEQYLSLSSSPTIQMSLITELLLKGWENALSELPKRRKLIINKFLNAT